MLNKKLIKSSLNKEKHVWSFYIFHQTFFTIHFNNLANSSIQFSYKKLTIVNEFRALSHISDLRKRKINSGAKLTRMKISRNFFRRSLKYELCMSRRCHKKEAKHAARTTNNRLCFTGLEMCERRSEKAVCRIKYSPLGIAAAKILQPEKSVCALKKCAPEKCAKWGIVAPQNRDFHIQKKTSMKSET